MSSGRGSSSRSGKGGGGGGNNNGVSSVPTSSKKLIQSLKEIVNFPENEIYAMLKECNMDPDETAQRLLSQDSFHEVKNKREKKKETKDTSETRPRGVSYPSNRGSRTVTDYNTGRSSSTLYNSTESGSISGKPALKKELRSHPSSTTSASVVAETSGWPSSFSDIVAPGNRTQTTASDGISSFPKLSPGVQSPWLGVPGQLSMADVVKMGRPQHKASKASVMSTENSYSPHTAHASVASHNVKHPLVSASQPAQSHHDLHSYPNSSSKVLETIHEPDIIASRHAHAEWPMAEKLPASSGSTFLEPTAVSEFYADPDQLNAHRANQNLPSRLEELQVTEDASTNENLNFDSSASASASNNLVQESNSGSQSHFDDDSYNMSSYQPHRPAFDHHEVSSATASLEQLHLREELGVPPAENNPAVRIPNHLQVPSANLSHLSFGSFGSGVSATVPVPVASPSPSLKNNLEEAFVVDDASAVTNYDSRHEEQYRDAIRSTSDGNSPRTGAVAGGGSYNSSSTSHPDVMKHDNAGAAREHQYIFPSSVHGYTLEDNSRPDASLSYAPSNAQMQNLASYPTAVQSFTDSLPSNFMSSTVQPARDSAIPYSSFPATQTLSAMYSPPTSSISGSAISMSETGKPDIYSMSQAMQQNLRSTNIVTGPSVSQQPTADHHPYSQQTLPLGNYANMVGYPFLPQSYTYVPSTFQQAYAGSSAYNQSPAAMHNNPGINYTLPQYKNSGSVTSLPQSAAAASGYGGGYGHNNHGNFLLNRLASPEMANITLDDLLRSQYKDANNFAMPIQNESSAMWVHGGPGASRATGSVLPTSAYYNLLGTNQQHAGLRTGGPQQPSQHHGGGQQQPSQHHIGGQQQPSQHHGGGLGGGYPNIYHSHSQTGGGVLQEQHHMQMSSDGTQHNSGQQQGQHSNQQSHQLWRQNY